MVARTHPAFLLRPSAPFHVIAALDVHYMEMPSGERLQDANAPQKLYLVEGTSCCVGHCCS